MWCSDVLECRGVDRFVTGRDGVCTVQLSDGMHCVTHVMF